jgi:hypothetical protein
MIGTSIVVFLTPVADACESSFSEVFEPDPSEPCDMIGNSLMSGASMLGLRNVLLL